MRFDPFRGSASSSPTILKELKLAVVAPKRRNVTRFPNGRHGPSSAAKRAARFADVRQNILCPEMLARWHVDARYVLDLLRGVISRASIRHRLGQRFQSGRRHQIGMWRNRSIGKPDLRGSFGTFLCVVTLRSSFRFLFAQANIRLLGGGGIKANPVPNFERKMEQCPSAINLKPLSTAVV